MCYFATHVTARAPLHLDLCGVFPPVCSPVAPHAAPAMSQRDEGAARPLLDAAEGLGTARRNGDAPTPAAHVTRAGTRDHSAKHCAQEARAPAPLASTRSAGGNGAPAGGLVAPGAGHFDTDTLAEAMLYAGLPLRMHGEVTAPQHARTLLRAASSRRTLASGPRSGPRRAPAAYGAVASGRAANGAKSGAGADDTARNGQGTTRQSAPQGLGIRSGDELVVVKRATVDPLVHAFAQRAARVFPHLYTLQGLLGVYALPATLCGCRSRTVAACRPCGQRRGTCGHYATDRVLRSLNLLWLLAVSTSVGLAVVDIAIEATTTPSSLYTVVAYLPAIAALVGLLWLLRGGSVHFLLATMQRRSHLSLQRGRRQATMAFFAMLSFSVASSTWIIWYNAAIARRASLESLSALLSVSITFPVRSLLECTLAITTFTVMAALREDVSEFFGQLAARVCEPHVAAVRFEATLDRVSLASHSIGVVVSLYIMALVVYFITFLIKLVEAREWHAADMNDVWYLCTVVVNACVMLLSGASANSRLYGVAKELSFMPAWLPKPLLGAVAPAQPMRSSYGHSFLRHRVSSRVTATRAEPDREAPDAPRMASASGEARGDDGGVVRQPGQSGLGLRHSDSRATLRQAKRGDVLRGSSEGGRLALYIELLQQTGTLGLRIGGIVVLYSRLAIVMYAVTTISVYCVHLALHRSYVSDISVGGGGGHG